MVQTLRLDLLEKGKKQGPVCRIAVDLFAFVASRGDVIDRALVFDAEESGHDSFEGTAKSANSKDLI
ncbi:MAG: hypothetical protein NTU59_07455 [Coprothermobacterota bacterium]|nr:hypothetical protein [Coprothermobacterota bacterium]